jgi:hypothetical protein
MARTKQLAQCLYCGEAFIPKGHWQQVCYPCYKGYKTGQTPPPWQTIAQQQAWINLLARELAETRQHLSDFQNNLPRLLQLCHPDRHGGSQAANHVTRWLLEQRQQLKGS